MEIKQHKKKIVTELRDEASDIHLLIGQYTESDFSNVKFQQIQQKYARNKGYKPSNFRANLKRLLKNLLSKTGDFKPEKIEPWYTSAKNVSTGYSLLYSLYMNPNHSEKNNRMSAKKNWESHEIFQLYDLIQFKTYNKNMKALTSKRKILIKEEEESFHRDMLKLPEKDVTSRGIPFWYKHEASRLVEEYVSQEIEGAAKIKPQLLWKSRKEYQEFPLDVFRKHLYQERTKRLAAPYWQHKRNAHARKRYEEVEAMLKEWNKAQVNVAVQAMIEDFEKVGI